MKLLKISLLALCVAGRANGTPLPFNRLLDQAQLWRPQKAASRDDLVADITVGKSYDDYYQTTITLHPITKPDKAVAKISYIVDLAEIRYLSVDPMYQRQGIASVLLGRTLHKLQQDGFTRAQVEAEPPSRKNLNTPVYALELARSIAFYEKNGGIVESKSDLSAKIFFNLTRR